MKTTALVPMLAFTVLLAACSAEQSLTPAPQASRTSQPTPTAQVAQAAQATNATIDPSIPALTITARRMSDTEKLAYDRATAVDLAALKTGN